MNNSNKTHLNDADISALTYTKAIIESIEAFPEVQLFSENKPKESHKEKLEKILLEEQIKKIKRESNHLTLPVYKRKPLEFFNTVLQFLAITLAALGLYIQTYYPVREAEITRDPRIERVQQRRSSKESKVYSVEAISNPEPPATFEFLLRNIEQITPRIQSKEVKLHIARTLRVAKSKEDAFDSSTRERLNRLISYIENTSTEGL